MARHAWNPPEEARRFMNAQERGAFLLRANEVLRASLVIEESLSALTRLLVPLLADWCATDAWEGSGEVRRIAVAHADPAREADARALLGTFAPEAEMPWGPLRALKTSRFIYFPRIEDPRLLATSAAPEHLAAVRELGLGAVVCFPMAPPTLQGVHGILTCVRGPGRAPFVPAELAMLRTLASRAGEAVVHSRLYREMQAASRAKDEFMAMLGHELRNPIAAITNAVRVLEQLGAADEPTVRIRTIIARQTRHLARLVDDLLDVARLTSGKITLRLKPMDLKKIAERCLALYEGMDGKRHEIVLDVESTVVSGDPTRLEQILGNLLDNAVKYTPVGGRIEISVRRNADSAVLAVRDSGVGIAPEMLPHVFDLFAQGAQPLSREGGGLGIGLTLVKRLAELHGGTVTAVSPGPGRGTRVEVTFPLAPAAAARASARPAVTPGAAPARRILIVEDNADARDALTALLSGDGHTVEVAGNAPEALERAGRFRPDVALIDIGLPGMDGYDLARRLRALEGPPMHLVALTGYGQASDRQRTREAGFEVHLVKPVDPEDLARVLAELDRPAAPAAS
ncbi:MAG TPA: ATP-binding protein [Methylomirabilota bacterium]|jgi:signal transduction histidine kinase/ActR/RegA family two-component response regulator|nr:ATP-binding protein [Methylomirabilota bacterium]